MFVVFGATGNTGKIVAAELEAARKDVRKLRRSSPKLDDADALFKVLDGAAGAYVMLPPDLKTEAYLAERKVWVDAIGAAIKRAKVPHVVFLSSLGAQHGAGTGPIRALHYGEQVLAASAESTSFIRAGYFAENFAGVFPVAQKDGVLPHFGPIDVRFPVVATKDIGTFAAHLLLEGGKGHRVFDFTGPAEVSAQDAAAALTQLLGKPITAISAPLDAIVPTFKNMGVSDDMAALYHEMISGMGKGLVAPTQPLTRGKTPLRDTFAALLGK